MANLEHRRPGATHPDPRGATELIELLAPLEWRPEELEQLRTRVRELVTSGHPRSVASQAAFGELVARRAIERARAEASGSIVPDGLPQPPEAA